MWGQGAVGCLSEDESDRGPWRFHNTLRKYPQNNTPLGKKGSECSGNRPRLDVCPAERTPLLRRLWTQLEAIEAVDKVSAAEEGSIASEALSAMSAVERKRLSSAACARNFFFFVGKPRVERNRELAAAK